nr:Morn repeat incomplete domain containing protein [Pandoravirus aubagnensis]
MGSRHSRIGPDDPEQPKDDDTPPNVVWSPTGPEETIGDCHLLALPDELLLAVLGALSDPAALACVARTARRLGALCRDDSLWRPLYERRYGQPLHKHFAEFGKDWCWLYRARAVRADPALAASVGCVAIKSGAQFFSGDLAKGVPCGYGLHITISTSSLSSSPQPLRDTSDPRTVFDLSRKHAHLRSEGEWARGVRHGRVIDRMASGDLFDGAHKRGLRHGEGMYVRHTGRVYCGAYKRGQRRGWGVEEYPDGRRYEGHWHVKRCGNGTMTLPDGRSHSGKWCNGIPDGWGVHTWPNGQCLKAIWYDGTPQGQGMLTTADGRCLVDEARELFWVGAVTIPAPIGGDCEGDSNNSWCGRIKRVCAMPRTSTIDGHVLDTAYVDGSHLLVIWGDEGQRAHRVALHSPSCATLDRTPSSHGRKRPDGTCMACLCNKHMRSTAKDRWYLAGTKS